MNMIACLNLDFESRFFTPSRFVKTLVSSPEMSVRTTPSTDTTFALQYLATNEKQK
jgi:hypothetical protein